MEKLEAISEVLREAKEWGLETEIVWSALESMKANPKQSIVEAIYGGLNEWVK